MNEIIKKKISVIVPVYNVEKYIDRCLKSITNQTYTNLEIILVDDGSTDLSGEKCEQWGRLDDRVKIIHKENAGLGYARNTGLDVITGDYVSFIDSDDFIELYTYEKLLDKIAETNCDICYFGCKYFQNEKIIDTPICFPDRVFDKNDICQYLLPLSFGASIQKEPDPFGIGSVCCGIYRSSMFQINHLRFGSERDILCEDILFTSKMLTYANRVAFINENFYYYFFNPKSLTHSYRKDRFEKTQKFYALQLDLISDKGLIDKCVERANNSFLINTIVCLKQEFNRPDTSSRSIRKTILDISNNKAFRRIYKSIDLHKLNLKKRLLFFSLFHKKTRIVYYMVKKKH